MNRADLVYGKTPIFRLYEDGAVEEYVCTGYTECETWDVTNRCYVITSFVHGRNERCSNAVFTFKAISEGYFTPLIGKDAFFSREELEAEVLRRKTEAANVKKAERAEINRFLKRKRK